MAERVLVSFAISIPFSGLQLPVNCGARPGFSAPENYLRMRSLHLRRAKLGTRLMVDITSRWIRTFCCQRRFSAALKTSFCGQFSRTGDFHTAMVKNAMKIVATVQMVRSFM
jgi:hypothetical protein